VTVVVTMAVRGFCCRLVARGAYPLLPHVPAVVACGARPVLQTELRGGLYQAWPHHLAGRL
jgi:hypothetical protein